MTQPNQQIKVTEDKGRNLPKFQREKVELLCLPVKMITCKTKQQIMTNQIKQKTINSGI